MIPSLVHEGKQIILLEPMGKAPTANIWCVDGYYRPGFAKRLTFYTQSEYDEFLDRYADGLLTLLDFDDWEAGRIQVEVVR